MKFFTRLFLLLAVLSTLPLMATILFLRTSSRDLEQRLHDQNEKISHRVSLKGETILQKILKTTHLKIVEEKARKLDGFFREIHDAVLIESALANQFLENTGGRSTSIPLFPADEVARRKETDEVFRTTFRGVKPYAIFHLAPGSDPARTAEPLDRLRAMGTFFAHAQRAVPACSSTYLGHKDGFILGYPGGNRFSSTYDPRARPWYQQTIARGGIMWTKIYLDKDGRNPVITCSNPLARDPEGSFLGVAAIDVMLNDILAELFAFNDLKVAEAILMDEEGRVRVSAEYKGLGSRIDTQTIREVPLVSQLSERGFARVSDQINRQLGQDSGVVWDEPAGQPGNLFLYATVHFREGDGSLSGAPATPAQNRNWRYIVQLPLEPLTLPVREIRAEVDGATEGISASIKAELDQSGAVILAITAGMVLVSLSCAYFAAHAVARPLRKMALIARKIGAGDLDQAVDCVSRDEVGQLGRAINAMIEGLKERDFVKGTFKRYVSAAVVDRMLTSRQIHLGGVNRNLTVFFSDLKGFTTLAEQLEPEVLVQVLNEYLDTMTESILAHEGTLDKYIGDAILAFWGDPIPQEDNAIRACRSALEQCTRLRRLWPGWDSRGLPRLEMRIGIQTGPVVVGNIGSSIQMNYTVLGDTVNFASRLEGINKIYGTQILIGEGTRQAAGDAIVVRELDLLAVKGKHEAERVFELLGMAGEVSAELIEGCQAYETALAAYRDRRWDDALIGLDRAKTILGGDRPSEVLIARIEGYCLKPPPRSWNGQYALTEK